MASWPDLDDLELFLTVVDTGGVAAAARALGMAQPNASRRLGAFESRIGLRLLDRSRTGTTPTAHGLVVAGWARQVLASATTFVDGAAALRHGPTCSVRIAASQTVAEHLLPRWLARARTAGQVSVDVVVTNTAGVLELASTGHIDVGFVEGPVSTGALHMMSVDQDELLLVVGAEHPWTRRATAVSARELLATALISRETGSGTRLALTEALGGCEPPVAMELASNTAIKVAVAAGAGPAVLSRLTVADALARGELVQVPLAGPRLMRRIRAVWAGPRTLTGGPGDLVDIARHAGQSSGGRGPHTVDR